MNPQTPFNNGQPLSPSQVQTMRAQFGIQPAGSPSATASSSWAQFDSLTKPQAPATMNTSTPPTAQAPIESPYNPIDSYNKNVNKAADTVAKTWSDAPAELGGNIKQMSKVTEGGFDINPFSKKSVDQAKNFGEGLLGLLGNSIKDVFAPVSAGVQVGADMISDNPVVQKIASSPAGKPLELVNKLNDWAAQHPEASQNLQNALNVFLGVVGEKAGGGDNVPSLKEVKGNVASDVKAGADTVKGGVSKVVDKASDVMSAAKEKIPGLKSPKVEPATITVGGKTMTLDDIHGPEGAKFIKTLSPADQKAFSAFDREQSIKGMLDTAKAKGDMETVQMLEQQYNQIKSNPTKIAGSTAKINPGGPALPKDVQQSVKDTMPLANKEVRIDDLRNTYPDSGKGKGGVTREGPLGKSTSQPAEEDIARGTVAHEYIKGVKDPVKKIANLNQGIRDTSTKTIDPFLDKNAAPSHFQDMREYMEKNRPTSNLQKDPGAFEAYNRATENALDTLYKTMKERATNTGDFGPNVSGTEIRQARIAIDQQIAKELGQETFGTPQYKGIKAAEIDTRNMLNRMNEDMLRYPGQLDKLNKMNELLSASKERGIEVDPAELTRLEQELGLKKTPESEANAKFLADQHKKMSYLYDARDNLIDKYQSSVGKNKVQELIKNNPVVKAGTGMVKKVIPFGIGSHL